MGSFAGRIGAAAQCIKCQPLRHDGAAVKKDSHALDRLTGKGYDRVRLNLMEQEDPGGKTAC